MPPSDLPSPQPHGPGRPPSLRLLLLLPLLFLLPVNAIPQASDDPADDTVLNPALVASGDVFDDFDYLDLGHTDPTLMCTKELLKAKEKQCFTEVPEKTRYAPLYSNLVLPCKVANKRGKMQWYKQGLGVFGE